MSDPGSAAPSRDSRGPQACRVGSPPLLERVLYHSSVALVALSGLVYAWMKYAMGPVDDPFRAFHHPLQPRALHLHILAAPLLLLSVGMMARLHVLPRLFHGSRRNRGRRTGLTSTLVLLPMIASGYLLQTVTHEGWRLGLVSVHLGSGGVFLLTYVGHVCSARRAKRERRARGVADSFEPWHVPRRDEVESISTRVAPRRERPTP